MNPIPARENDLTPPPRPRALFLDQSGQPGGAELCLLDVVTRLRCAASVCTFADGPFPQRLRAAGMETIVLDGAALGGVSKSGGRMAWLGAGAGFLKLVAAVLPLARGADAIYANTLKALPVGAAAARLTGRPLIFHLHDLLSAEHFSRANRALVVRVANACAARVIANSHATAAAFVEAGGDARRVIVIHNGIDAAAFDAVDEAEMKAAQAALKANDEAVPVIGLFGRFAPWKGQLVALDALTRLPGVRLALVGDALFGEHAYRATLLDKITRNGLHDRVAQLGFRDDVPALMKACAVVIHCSTAAEPFGRVIAEAQLAGTPVIATDAGGAREIVRHGVTGLLVPPGDAAALASAVRSLLDDGALARRLALAAHASAREKFALDAVVNATDAVIRATCAARRPAMPR